MASTTDTSSALFSFNFHIRVIRVLFLGSSFDFLFLFFCFSSRLGLQSESFVLFDDLEPDPVVNLLELVGLWRHLG